MPLFHVRYDSARWVKIINSTEEFIKYKILRPILSVLAWQVYGKRKFKKSSTNFSGLPLKKGISIVLPAKNEEYSIKPCLVSLIGIANQFILIDNGSVDRTLAIMKEFAEKMKEKCEVIVLERPESSLIEMRQEGLSYVKFNWVIRGDADMVFTEEMKKIREFALKQTRACAIYIKKFNLFGDLEHIHRIDSPFAGEYFLRNFDRNIQFVEYYGRLEHAPLPLYYKMQPWKEVAFFHIDCSKPNDRIFYRTCYLDWREDKNKKQGTPEFEEYQKLWNVHNFGTNNKKSLDYRFSRLIASVCKHFIEKDQNGLPQPLMDQINEEPFRFFIEYKNNQPWLRHDRKNPLQRKDLISLDDEQWIPSMEKFKSDKLRKEFKFN